MYSNSPLLIHPVSLSRFVHTHTHTSKGRIHRQSIAHLLNKCQQKVPQISCPQLGTLDGENWPTDHRLLFNDYPLHLLTK